MGLSVGFIKRLFLCFCFYSIVLQSSSQVIPWTSDNLKAIEDEKDDNNDFLESTLLDAVSTKEKRLINTEAEAHDERTSQLIIYFNEINFDQLISNVYLSFRQNGFIFFVSNDKQCSTCQFYAHNAASAFVKLVKEYKSGISFYLFDCSSNPSYCEQELGIHAYPTLAYYHNMGDFTFFNSHTPFKVLKKIAETVRPLNNLDGKPHIEDVVRLKELESLENRYPVFFLYLHDYGSTSEDFDYLRMFSRSLAGYAPIFRSDDLNLAKHYDITRLPHLLAVRNGIPFSYPAKYVSCMRNTIRMCSWAAKQKYALVPELTPEFAKTIDEGAYLAIALISPTSRDIESNDLHDVQTIAKQWIQTLRSNERSQLLQARKEWWDYVKRLKAKGYQDIASRASHPLPLPENKKITFVWLNALHWKSWLSDMFSIKSIPQSRFLFVHPSGLNYWDHSEDGTLLTLDQPSHIVHTALGVSSIEGRPPHHKLTVSREYFWLIQIKEFLAFYQIYLWLLTACFILVVYWPSVITSLKQRSLQHFRKSI
ncbi:protein disulfide isomerase [Schizosaccharomyces osmophilus]|uniref:Protein disulfide isomerase n=1 Tax=Schizosaccharomyces osmophilus TaxID=2545709 RepID=A0AAE9WFC2_9SCHI|nr:protein disulfide isomerase [Schizosaccharomyces osmophilus]WBW75269.1 protein disulfide isomerase [Schizosaccharomyces osmophilus]